MLRARGAVATMLPSAQLSIETTDPLAGIDIPSFACDEGHQLITVMSVRQMGTVSRWSVGERPAFPLVGRRAM
jgi:TusA-related sulfurtransferase